MDWEKGYTEDYERLHEKADSSTDLKGTFMDIRINKVLFQRAVIFEIVEIDDNRRVIAMKINPDRVITSKQLDEKPDVLLVLTDTNKEKGLGMMVNLENDKIEPIGEFKR